MFNITKDWPKSVHYHESIIWASAHYLAEQLPEEYVDWEEQKLDDFLRDNVWQPFEYYDVNFVWECIIGLAYDFRETLNNKIKKDK